VGWGAFSLFLVVSVVLFLGPGAGLGSGGGPPGGPGRRREEGGEEDEEDIGPYY
jgi:hypothetical protein